MWGYSRICVYGVYFRATDSDWVCMSVCMRIHFGVYVSENLRLKKNRLYNIHFLYLIHEHTL